jgi:spoIIIJ-associated protein
MEERNNDARPSAEFTARSVADALKRAEEVLGVPAEQLQYEIVKDKSHSILGLVRTGEVVIRAWAPSKGGGIPAKLAPSAPVDDVDEEAYEEEIAKPAASAAKGIPPELERIAGDVLSTLLDKMGILAAVEMADPGGDIDPKTGEASPMVLNIVGDDLGALIGRRGETLRDLQFITRLILSRKLGMWPDLVLDVEGYKAKRVSALESLALRMATQVYNTRQPVTLEPMPAHERRIIHLTLRDHPHVYTESTGVDEARKVQILLK